MSKKIYIILPVICLIIIIFYYAITYYKTQWFIQEILEEWKLRTNGGYVKLSKSHHYKNDYYLTFDEKDNRDTHIHLIICKKIHSYEYLNYVIKRNHIHSELYQIDNTTSAEEVVDDMLENYNNFDF